MRFFFKGIQSDNSIVSSSVDASDREEAVQTLTKKGIRIISIETKKTAKEASLVLQLFDRIFKKKEKQAGAITTKILLKFFVKLHKMLSCGLTLSDSITSINKRTTDPTEKKLTNHLLADISSGEPLSESIKKLGTEIDNTVYSMILVGETSGNLSDVLGDVVRFLESKNNLRKKMISSIIYPSFLITLAIAVLLLFSFFLIPQIEKLVKDLGGEMSGMTKFLMSLSDYVIYLLPVIIVTIFAGSIILPKMRTNEAIRYRTDKLLLRLPMFSTIIPLFSKTNLTNLMATLLSNGITTSEALGLVETSINNRVLLGRFQRAKTDILDGRSVCESMEYNDVLDGEACDLIEVGEKTGDLATAFKDVYKMYDENLKAMLKKLTITASSAAMLFAFALIGILALGIVQAIMSASAAAGTA